MSTLVTGGTGWIGRQLVPRLSQAVVVSRRAITESHLECIEGQRSIQCDLVQREIAPGDLSEVRSVINLMGEPIAEGRWTESKKDRIRRSRVTGTRNLVNSLLQSPNLPHTVISASAIGYYGDRGDDICLESTSPGNDYLSNVCVDWENALNPLADAGVRIVRLRFGIVLGRGGGVYGKMHLPFRLGLGGRLGSGRQWMSWIHIQDLIEMVLFCLDHPEIEGVFNATSPNPVRNSLFARSLGRALRRPTIFPVPEFAIRFFAGELANTILASQRVLPAALNGSGFTFHFPELDDVWRDLIPQTA